jgi:hypothetical protein
MRSTKKRDASPLNIERAIRAEAAIKVFTEGKQEFEDEDVATDLAANILHWIDQHTTTSIDDFLWRIKHHFDAEKGGSE